MAYNRDNKNTWWFVSDEGIMLNKDVWGGTTLFQNGAGDSIEQTYRAFIAYGDANLVNSILDCWKYDADKDVYRPQRYPIHFEGERPMSRDHVIYSMLAFLASKCFTDKQLKKFADKVRLPWTFGTYKTPKLWLWLKLITGRKIGVMYYPLALYSAVSNYLLNKTIEKVAGFGLYKEPDQNSFVPMFNNEKPKIVNTLSGLIYPTYAVILAAHMINVVGDNWWSRMTKKYLLKMTPDKNYIIKLLLGHSLTDSELDDCMKYKSMTCSRWSGQLNKWFNDRPIYIVEKKFGKQYTVENDLDRDYLVEMVSLHNK